MPAVVCASMVGRACGQTCVTAAAGSYDRPPRSASASAATVWLSTREHFVTLCSFEVVAASRFHSFLTACIDGLIPFKLHSGMPIWR